MKVMCFFAAVCAVWTVQPLWALTEYPGKASGKAVVEVTPQGGVLKNKTFTANFRSDDTKVTFGGLKTADGAFVAKGGTDLFVLNLADGTKWSSSDMRMIQPLKAIKLKATPNSLQLAKQYPGKALTAAFVSPDGKLNVTWSAILRDGSPYLRQQITVTAKQETAFKSLEALHYDLVSNGELSLSGNTTHGKVAVNNLIFCGLETPMSLMFAGEQGKTEEKGWMPTSWHPGSFGAVFNLPQSFLQKYGDAYVAKDGPVLKNLKTAEGEVSFLKAGECKLTFAYAHGNNKLNILGVQLLTADGKIVCEDVHAGRTGDASVNNVYTVQVPQKGNYRLRYWVSCREEPITSSGAVSFSLPLGKNADDEEKDTSSDNTVRGVWRRNATLSPKEKKGWTVSSVIGFFAPQQQRRSFLFYSERERASHYRPFVHYNDWYEIGIRLHDHKDPKMRTSEKMWEDLLNTWKRELFTKRKTNIDAFVIDDGWDEFNSLWDFHVGFPQGFTSLSKLANTQSAGLGAWLGPVGGYGFSKQQRLNNWNAKHPDNKIDNFKLSNEEYFQAFVGRCKQMIRDYDMRYFKFDGISTKFHANGPSNEEDAEGIIRVLNELRAEKPSIFINTTVGTWASPFWFRYADSIWRQENDFGQCGTAGDARDKWITYRDRLVHEVFVVGAPLFPINSLMTHGTIITKNGPPHVMSKDPENCKKEIRAAFGCGSALQEIYADQDLLNQKDGMLWDELAANIRWVRRNRDVLDDIHWVGGNPWNGKDGEIYGWAAWNKKKCTLALRNSSASQKTLSTTLRAVLDVPPTVKGKIVFKNSHSDQTDLKILTAAPVDIDAPIDITMKPLDVIVLEGRPTGEK